MRVEQQVSVAERRLAEEVLAATSCQDVGDSFTPTPDSEICSYLERYVPEVLSRKYGVWSGESLDGVFVIQGSVTNSCRVSLLGTAILLRDQRVAPLLVEVEASSSGDSIVSYRIRLGEPGGGPLGISGPACNSGASSRLLHRLPNRVALQRVDWVFFVEM